ncbi:hypothetical protein [Spongiibacter sp.]|uniref:hypothetical protein n=1 Tax=Spongiibacter sp. TaxID=2024860 RepID=UPI000C585B9A|nr:hypothetical protein [Spongiibacter sp.]MBU72841.1 hypothetical protein [Spongiibacter sp.]
MEEIIKKFSEEHEGVSVTKDEQTYRVMVENSDWHERNVTRYLVDKVKGLEAFQLVLREEEDFTKLSEVLSKEPELFEDFLAVSFSGRVEVYLNNIGRSAYYRFRERSDPIEIEVNYHRNELRIQIKQEESKETSIGILASLMRGVRFPRRASTILAIEGLERPTSEGLESDVRNIINSVLFDIECSYGLVFETANIENYKSRPIGRRNNFDALPEAPVQLIYKEYIPELIEYFHIAQKVDYLPFKYICYFHVVEYFMDKAAYALVSRKIKNLMSNPDFHIKSNEYISQAINIFKKENEKYTTDKIKIGRVLREYVEKDSILGHIENLELTGHFTKEYNLQCAKTLNICAITIDNDNAFYDTLTKRIYALRCSIVHSNPDFDESKAVPFISTPENMNFLRDEIELLREISRRIIVNSIA